MGHVCLPGRRSASTSLDPATTSIKRSSSAILRAAMCMASIVLACCFSTAKAQSNEWAWMDGSLAGGSSGVYGTLGTPAQSNIPGVRQQPVTWTDSNGNLWLFGGVGYDSVSADGYLNDLWKFDPSANEWTWMGGSSTLPGDYSAGPGVYGTLGAPAAGNIPSGRAGAVSWNDAKGNFWLFGGYSDSAAGTFVFNDLWEFNPLTNEWAWMGGCNPSACNGSNSDSQPGVYGTLGLASPKNQPGSRDNAMSWADGKGNLWLFGGTGYDSAGNQGNLNDLWEFSTSTNEWTWVSGANTINQLAVSGSLDKPAAGNVPAARNGGVSWVDTKGNLWLFGGAGFNDLWEFNPSTSEWVWVSGNPVAPAAGGQPGIYGELQTPAANDVPGSRFAAVSWTDSSGNLWLFGGLGYDSAGTLGLLDDLWEFNTTADQWIWMSGDPTVPPGSSCSTLDNWCGDFGVYGSLQIPGLGDHPGGRFEAASWTDSKGNFWLFGGGGFDGQGDFAGLNDLWQFQPNTNSSQITATPVFTPGSGTNSTWETVTLSDGTPGATISYSINGSTPALAYTSPIVVSSSETIQAIASASGYANSNIATAKYIAGFSQAEAPTFDLAQGNYPTTQTVTISSSTPGTTIYYAIGSAPTAASTVYSGPITVSAPETIEAIAIGNGYLNSQVATAAYNIAPGTSAQWVWMGGSSTIPQRCATIMCGAPGWYGTLQTTATGNVPGGRSAAAHWTDNQGDLWLFGGTGFDSAGNLGNLNDLWEFDPTTSEWTWISGSSVIPCVSVGNCGAPSGVYGTLGSAAATNTPGGRQYPASWTDKNGRLWLFGGYGADAEDNFGLLNDLWEFDPSTKKWTWVGGSNSVFSPSCEGAGAFGYCGSAAVYGTLRTTAPANVPGGRESSVTWTDENGNLWLFGGFGYAPAGADNCQLDDLWEFNPTTAQWTWINGSQYCGYEGYPPVYGMVGVPAVGNTPGSISAPVSWTDPGGNLWMFGGGNSYEDITDNDSWTFYPSLGEWAFASANSMDGDGNTGTYGMIGVWSAQNIPQSLSAASSWTDNNGNLWLFGGIGAVKVGNPTTIGSLNDLWEFNPAIDEWVWMGGDSSSDNQPGVYGTLGTPAAANFPGGRYDAITWTDNSGNLWLFGGDGFGAGTVSTSGYLNDLWRYGLSGSPSATPPTAAATPVLTPTPGTYTSPQNVTISDTTAGTTIYYTTNGTTPNSSSAIYTAPLAIPSSETIEAIAVANGYGLSATAIGTYAIDIPQAASPTFSVASGTYDSAQAVTISDATSGTTIYYTTNGTTPTTTSSLYTAAITVSATETIETIAVAAGYLNSTVDSAAYTITPPSTFTLQASPGSMTISAGTQGTITLTVTPEYGFNSAISFSCSGLPAGAACSFSPATLTPSGAAVTSVLTISTASQSAQRHSYGRSYAGGITFACTVVLLVFRRRRLPCRLFLMAALIAMGTASGCGGASTLGGSGTTPVTSTVTVTATAITVQQAAAISLTVE
jgi:N-acetylneuraminic acid mutarotase